MANKRIKLICQNDKCGKSFTEIISKVKRGKGKFCSLECYKEFRRKRIIIDRDEKTCSSCNKIKPVNNFAYRSDTRDRLSSQCSNCRKITQIKTKYKVSALEAKRLFDRQKYGICDVCGMTAIEHQDKYNSRLHIDHDHLTGKIRGILCKKCNVSLGHFSDSIDILRNLIKYLQK